MSADHRRPSRLALLARTCMITLADDERTLTWTGLCHRYAAPFPSSRKPRPYPFGLQPGLFGWPPL